MRNKLLIFLFASASMSAQVLLPTPETVFERQHHFNPVVIREHNIRRVIFEIIDKRDFEVAEDKNLVENYEFNASGLLNRHYSTRIVRSVEKEVVGRRGQAVTVREFQYDTVGNRFYYDTAGRMIQRRYNDGSAYYESHYFRYNNLGWKTKELRYRETNVGTEKTGFMLGNQVLISEDSLQYVVFSSGQVKCTLLNNEGLPFKERIINRDSSGNWTSVDEFYTVAAWLTQKFSYTYDGGRMTSASYTSSDNNKFQVTYEYDPKNKELYTEKHFRNDILIREISYITDRINGLLNSFIIRDPINKTMRIVKLRYDVGMIGASGQ